MKTQQMMQYKKIVTFSLAIAVTVELITGVLLFLPELGIEMEDYLMAGAHPTLVFLHEWFGYASIILACLHIALNWKIIKRYPRTLLKSPVRRITGLSLIGIGTFSAITGIIIALVLKGSGGHRGGRWSNLPPETTTEVATFLGLTREDYIFWHEYISLAIIALIAIHIFLNWKVIRFYIFGPKKTARTAKTSIPFFELNSIEHVLIIHETGPLIDYRNFVEEKLNAELLSGLLSALRMVSEEILQRETQDYITVHKYESLTITLIHGQHLTLALVGRKPLSQSLANNVRKDLIKIEERFRDAIVNWQGNKDSLAQLIHEICSETYLGYITARIDVNSIDKRKYKALYQKLLQYKDAETELTIKKIVPRLSYKEIIQLDKGIRDGTIKLIKQPLMHNATNVA